MRAFQVLIGQKIIIIIIVDTVIYFFNNLFIYFFTGLTLQKQFFLIYSLDMYAFSFSRVICVSDIVKIIYTNNKWW